MAAVALFSSVSRATPPPATTTPANDLASTAYFAFGGVGYAGITSPGELQFREIMRQKDAAAQFEAAFKTGTDAGKVYALAGLYQIDRPIYLRLKSELTEEQKKSTVQTMNGCFLGTESIAAILARLERGSFAVFVSPPEAKPSSSRPR